jgi:hypothetical protein
MKIYPKLAEAIDNANDKSYIVSWFSMVNNHWCIKFISFDGIHEFMTIHRNFDSLHELILTANNTKPINSFVNRLDGRLCFDFDINIDFSLDLNQFKVDVESVVKSIAVELYDKINVNLFEFVWSTSANPKKHSKHLTIKNLLFDDWQAMSKQFYFYFHKKWNEFFHYIDSYAFLDKQIVRNNASLRMVTHTKPDKTCPLTLDNQFHTLTDSLVRPLNIANEQRIHHDQLLMPIKQFETKNNQMILLPNSNSKNVLPVSIPFDDPLIDGIFFRNSSSTDGNIIYHHYKRIKESHCRICNRAHSTSNAYIKIDGDKITFHCFRSTDKPITLNKNFEIEDKINHVKFQAKQLKMNTELSNNNLMIEI